MNIFPYLNYMLHMTDLFFHKGGIVNRLNSSKHLLPLVLSSLLLQAQDYFWPVADNGSSAAKQATSLTPAENAVDGLDAFKVMADQWKPFNDGSTAWFPM